MLWRHHNEKLSWMDTISEAVATFEHVCWSFNPCNCHHQGCLNNPIYHASCWAHFTCHHELWPASVCNPYSSLSNPFCLAGGNYYKKITIPIFRLVLHFFLFEVAFLIFCDISLFIFTFFWMVCYSSMWLCFSPVDALKIDVELISPMTCQFNWRPNFLS